MLLWMKYLMIFRDSESATLLKLFQWQNYQSLNNHCLMSSLWSLTNEIRLLNLTRTSMRLTFLNPKLSVAFLTIDVSTNSMMPASKDSKNSSLSPNHQSMLNQLSSNLYMHIFLSFTVSWTWEIQCLSNSTRLQKSKQASIPTISASTIPSIISRRSNKSFKFLTKK